MNSDRSSASRQEAVTRPWRRQKVLEFVADDLTMDELLRTLDRGVVYTVNPQHLVLAQHDRRFADAYRRADFITVDSKYVYMGMKLIGRGIREKISGSDLVPAYYEYHGRLRDDTRIFLLGAAPGVGARAMERINARVGWPIVIGAHSPSMGFDGRPAETDEVIRIINESGANTVMVGMNAPRQEIWISSNRHRMPGVKVWMGIGATIDYEAGNVQRAPVWMRKIGMEWSYRVITQPRRYWKRYAKDMRFFYLLALDGLGLYRVPPN